MKWFLVPWAKFRVRIVKKVDSMLQLIKRHVPKLIKNTVKRTATVLGKPELSNVELHLTDHCNLNCKGCGHFSPIASPYYASINQHELDMRRLSHLFKNIRTIRLMGGEPLLHPDAASFIAVTRRLFPLADIRFVTNGILLTNAPDAFWMTCRDTHTVIDMTVYPPLRSRIEDLQSLCMSKGVSLNPREMDLFHAHMNLSGSSDERSTFAACRSTLFYPFLKNGRLYHCAWPALIHYFNEWFDYDIPADAGIDIYSSFLSGRRVLQLLNKPIASCKYCTFDIGTFPWTKSAKMLSEWDAEFQRNLTEKAAVDC